MRSKFYKEVLTIQKRKTWLKRLKFYLRTGLASPLVVVVLMTSFFVIAW